MLTVRTLTIVLTGSLLLGAGALSTARANDCSDDRFPCPASEPAAQTQETADAPSAQPRKKVERNARRDEKERARAEREAARAPARAKATKSADREPDYDAFPRRDVSSQRDESPSNVLEQVAAPKKAGTALPKSLNDEVDRNESQVASAAAAWLVLPATDGTGDSAQSLQDANQDANAAATTIAAAVPLPADGMRPADGTPAADPDAVATFAGAPAPAPAESTWLGYLFMTLGGALAAASTVRYLLV